MALTVPPKPAGGGLGGGLLSKRSSASNGKGLARPGSPPAGLQLLDRAASTMRLVETGDLPSMMEMTDVAPGDRSSVATNGVGSPSQFPAVAPDANAEAMMAPCDLPDVDEGAGRVRPLHVLTLFGEGSFLAPYFLELSDFLVHAALKVRCKRYQCSRAAVAAAICAAPSLQPCRPLSRSDNLPSVRRDAAQDALGSNAAAVAAVINLRLQQIDRYRHDWRGPMATLLQTLSKLNEHLRKTAADVEAEEPRVLALAHVPPQEYRQQLLLLVGVGEPQNWALPPRAQLLSLETLPSLDSPVGFHSLSANFQGRVLEILMKVVTRCESDVTSLTLRVGRYESDVAGLG